MNDILDISRKHFETTNSTRPNPPTPLPYEGRGISKPLSASLRGLERGLLSFSEMSIELLFQLTKK
jgi:hypothetical protein